MARLDPRFRGDAIQQARVHAPMILYRLDGPLLQAMTGRVNTNKIALELLEQAFDVVEFLRLAARFAGAFA